jgi:hypothetical protein
MYVDFNQLNNLMNFQLKFNLTYFILLSIALFALFYFATPYTYYLINKPTFIDEIKFKILFLYIFVLGLWDGNYRSWKENSYMAKVAANITMGSSSFAMKFLNH